MGFAVTACHDADTALEEVRRQRFDLVITDLRLGQGDGLAVMEEQAGRISKIVKDLLLFFKNRFFALVTILGLVAYAVIYYFIPNSVDETLEIGLYAPDFAPTLTDQVQSEGLLLNRAESEDALKAAVIAGDYPVGVALPADMLAQLRGGQKPRVNVYFTSEMPEEFRDAYTLLLEELSFMMSGQALNIEATEEVLGPDMAGRQVAPRNRMLPLFAVFILMIEAMGLASLISSEIVGGTLRALLVTPMRVEGLFVGKGITGVLLSFSQATALMAVTGGLRQQPLLILLALLLGSLLVTGAAFMIASVAKDIMSVMAWGMLVFLLFSIPSFNVMLPGLTSQWIKVIPSYYLVDTMHQVINFQAGWSAVGNSLLALLAFTVALFGLGIVVLRRRFQ